VKFIQKSTMLAVTMAATVALPFTAATAGPAASTHRLSAGVSAVQQAVNMQLARRSGGNQVSSNVISYDNGKTLVAFAPAGVTYTSSDCPGGWLCLYNGTSLTGSRLLKFQSEGYFQDLRPYAMPIYSYWNNRGNRMFFHQFWQYGGFSACVSAGTKNYDSSGSWIRNAESIYLAKTNNAC